MYEIRAAVGFSAAHFLRGYEGKCARLHGHTWRVRAAVCGSDLGPGEMVIDFHDLEAMLGEAVAPFDHSCLNDLEPFDRLSGAAVCGSDLGPGEMVIDFHDLEAMLAESMTTFSPIIPPGRPPRCPATRSR